MGVTKTLGERFGAWSGFRSERHKRHRLEEWKSSSFVISNTDELPKGGSIRVDVAGDRSRNQLEVKESVHGVLGQRGLVSDVSNPKNSKWRCNDMQILRSLVLKKLLVLIAIGFVVTTLPASSQFRSGQDAEMQSYDCQYGQCSAIKADGTRCKNCAQKGSIYCWSHR